MSYKFFIVSDRGRSKGRKALGQSILKKYLVVVYSPTTFILRRLVSTVDDKCTFGARVGRYIYLISTRWYLSWAWTYIHWGWSGILLGRLCDLVFEETHFGCNIVYIATCFYSLVVIGYCITSNLTERSIPLFLYLITSPPIKNK